MTSKQHTNRHTDTTHTFTLTLMDYTDIISRKHHKIHLLQQEIKKIQHEIECLSADPYKMASQLKTSQSCPEQLSSTYSSKLKVTLRNLM